MPDMQRLTALAIRGDCRAQREYWAELLRRGDIQAIMDAVCDPPTEALAWSATHALAKRGKEIRAAHDLMSRHACKLHREDDPRPRIAPYDPSQVIVTLDGERYFEDFSDVTPGVTLEGPLDIPGTDPLDPGEFSIGFDMSDADSRMLLRRYRVGQPDAALALASALERLPQRPDTEAGNAAWVDSLIEEVQQYPPPGPPIPEGWERTSPMAILGDRGDQHEMRDRLDTLVTAAGYGYASLPDDQNGGWYPEGVILARHEDGRLALIVTATGEIIRQEEPLSTQTISRTAAI